MEFLRHVLFYVFSTHAIANEVATNPSSLAINENIICLLIKQNYEVQTPKRLLNKTR